MFPNKMRCELLQTVRKINFMICILLFYNRFLIKNMQIIKLNMSK